MLSNIFNVLEIAMRSSLQYFQSSLIKHEFNYMVWQWSFI